MFCALTTICTHVLPGQDSKLKEKPEDGESVSEEESGSDSGEDKCRDGHVEDYFVPKEMDRRVSCKVLADVYCVCNHYG